MADLTTNMLEFSALLRSDYDISAGHARAYEALRALDVVGVVDRARSKYALRAVFCSRPEEIPRFDKAFDAFFGRRTMQRTRSHKRFADREGHDAAVPVARPEPSAQPSPAEAWFTMQARFSPVSSETRVGPAVPESGLAETLAETRRLIAGLRLGRSRRWKAHVRGARFDLRRTLRASLQTGGDPARIRTLGHPLRNPRVFFLIDASRSMSEHSDGLLRFAYALCRRSKRARVFVFSTALREVTAELRAMTHKNERRLAPLGEAWGGGTRIGSCLLEFTRKFASHLDADALAIVASDGLDAGDVSDVRYAMRQIYRRSAGVIWLNPHAAQAGFEPAAAGMKAALPYVSALVDASDLKAVAKAARHLRK